MPRRTKRPMVFAAVRMPQADRDKWYAAAKLLGVSQSELLRVALRERCDQVLVSAAKGESR